MLHTSGTDILTGENRKIALRGINLGNWMLIEPNMFGTAGTERKTRQAMELLAGKEKTDLFFTDYSKNGSARMTFATSGSWA